MGEEEEEEKEEKKKRRRRKDKIKKVWNLPWVWILLWIIWILYGILENFMSSKPRVC